MSQEKLLYLSNDPRRDFVDRIVDWAFLQSVRRIETEGSERNIPPKGPLVVGFAPHSGWLEVFVINHYLRKMRASGQGAVWLTKKENAQNVPHWVRGERRLLFLDRGRPTPQAFRSALKIMAAGGLSALPSRGPGTAIPKTPRTLKRSDDSGPALSLSPRNRACPSFR